MEDSIFTKIINGDIPSFKIYEDEHTFAFLDIHPSVDGHVLVVPKKQVEFLWDLDEATYSAVLLATKKIALHLRSVMDVPFVGEKVVGVDVPHAHIHLIPFSDTADYQRTGDQASEPDFAKLEKIAEKLHI